MSLQLAAQHLADKGRGPDTTLVHMSNKEVKSLNDLAMAHGGQLTINPQTGLPEAGFLSSILPMVAGAALTGMSGGLINPMTAGLLVGAGSYALNPKAGLMGGLMAGMGAYGGAGLGEALAQQGMEQVAGQQMLEGQVAENTARMGSNLTPEALTKTGLQPGQYGYGLSGEMAGGDMATTLTGPQYGAGMSNAQLNAGLASQTIPERLSTMGQGVKSLGTEGGLSSLTNRLGGGMKTAQTALAAAAPAMQPTLTTPPEAKTDKDMGQRYTYTPGVAQPLPSPDVPTYEDMLTKQGNFGRMQSYFPGQQYQQVSADQAKSIYGFAGGGPVEAMSNANAIGANTGFPQAYLHNNAYATPYQTPISQNVLTGAGDVSVDPYTGEQRMAAGGVSYDPKTQQYSKGISEALRPENRDVNIYNDTGGPGSAGGNSTSSSPGTDNGSPTGSVIGDAGYAISNQSISPIAAAIAGAMMDAMSPTSNVSVNAVNGMDSSSDAAAAAAAASAAAGGEGAPGMGGDGPGPSSVGDSGAAGGGGGGAVGEARGGLSPYFTHHMATGGISDAGYNLGGYSDGGRLLRGPGDGVSDSIPAVIGKKQPARLADGEFVVPARIVSELGNGSTEAGARKLYAMMDRIQAARGKTVGKGRVAKNSRSEKYLPA